jgi:hypothetical protein
VSGRPTGITFLVRQGLRFLAESEGGDPEDFLPSEDAEEQ